MRWPCLAERRAWAASLSAIGALERQAGAANQSKTTGCCGSQAAAVTVEGWVKGADLVGGENAPDHHLHFGLERHLRAHTAMARSGVGQANHSGKGGAAEGGSNKGQRRGQ